MRTEDIERYLTRQMADEEREAFEQEMSEQPQLAEDVKIVAWTIEAIRERGKQEDAKRLERMREQMGSDSKRYTATVAAVIGGVLVVAAMTAVSIPPLYNKVIKPAIESVFGSSDKEMHSVPQQAPATAPADSLSNSTDTDSVDADSPIKEENDAMPNEPQQTDEPTAKEEKTEQLEVKEEPTKEVEAKPAVAEEKREPEPKKEETALPTPVARFKPVTKSIENTKYTLTNLTGNSAGIVTAYVTIVNNNNNDVYVDIGDVNSHSQRASLRTK